MSDHTCRTKNCERNAVMEVHPSAIKRFKLGSGAEPRRFCMPCFHSWREGARTTFSGSVPQGSRVE